jgi:hypothetical protein
MPAEIGTTKGLKAVVPISSPSTADSTLIGGCQNGIPIKQCSAKDAEGEQNRAQRGRSPDRGFGQGEQGHDAAFAAIVGTRGPSKTYFSETTMTRTQKIADIPPRMFSA